MYSFCVELEPVDKRHCLYAACHRSSKRFATAQNSDTNDFYSSYVAIKSETGVSMSSVLLCVCVCGLDKQQSRRPEEKENSRGRITREMGNSLVHTPWYCIVCTYCIDRRSVNNARGAERDYVRSLFI